MEFHLRARQTHGPILWTMVGVFVASLSVLVVYMILTVGVRFSQRPVSGHPINVGAIQPSLFGTVTGIADGIITVDSKQSFTTIATDSRTKLTSITGSPFSLADLKSGAVIAATGKDAGNGRLAAVAVTIISNSGMGMPQAAATTNADAFRSKDVKGIVASGREITAPFTLARNDGARKSKIVPTATSSWWLSPDGKWLADIEGSGSARTATLIDLSTRHIVQ